MTALTLSWAVPARAGTEDPIRPPIQRPAARSAEPEPEVTEPELVQPNPEPTSVPAPGIELAQPEVLPSYSDTDAPEPDFEPEEPIARDVPRDGRGMLTIGSFALVGGVALAGGAAALALGGSDSGFWGPTIVLASGATLAGSLLVYGGTKRRRAYRKWAAAQTDVAPRQGNGLVGAGGVMLIVGATGGTFGTVSWVVGSFGYNPDGSTSPLPPTMLGIGLGSLAAGTAMMIVGMNRHQRFQAWRRATGGVELTPIVAPLAHGGGQIGIAGRF